MWKVKVYKRYDVLPRHAQHNQHEQINAFGVIEICDCACLRIKGHQQIVLRSVCCAHKIFFKVQQMMVLQALV